MFGCFDVVVMMLMGEMMMKFVKDVEDVGLLFVFVDWNKKNLFKVLFFV